MTRALTVAGSDPTGAAGLEVDLRVFQSFGLHGSAVATALTVQDSEKVYQVGALPAVDVQRRLEVLLADLEPKVVKFGMLATKELVQVAVDLMTGPLAQVPMVLDPVLVSSSGAPLLSADAWPLFFDGLFPLATVATPNHSEASLLLGGDQENLSKEQLAQRLSACGPCVVVTGGDDHEPLSTDVVCAGGEAKSLSSPRIGGASPHGTGCTFSAAIAAGLALGYSPLDAIEGSKEFTQAAIGRAEVFGKKTGKPIARF